MTLAGKGESKLQAETRGRKLGLALQINRCFALAVSLPRGPHRAAFSPSLLLREVILPAVAQESCCNDLSLISTAIDSISSVTAGSL